MRLGPAVRGDGFVSHECRLRSRERSLVRPRIDRKKQLALMNEVSLFEMHVKKFAGHLSFHRNGVAADVADGG